MAFIRKLKRGDKTYLVKVESYRENGKIKQRYLGYVGKEIDNKRILTGSVANADVTKVSIYGPLLVLHEIAKEIGLPNALGEYSAEMLSLIYAHCIQPSSLTKITEWYERTDLNHLLNFEKLTEKRLLNAIDYYDDERIAAMQNLLFVRLQDAYNASLKAIFYDLTNVYFYGKKCSLAKNGQNSEHCLLPQIQIGLAVTKEEGFPIFHKVYAGNVHDSRTLEEIKLMFREKEIRDVTFTWDRGITSSINIKEVKNIGAEVLCGIPIKGELKRICGSQKDIVSIKNMIPLKNTALYVVSRKHNYGGVSGTLYVCFNPKEKEIIREQRNRRIIESKEERDKGTTIPPGLKKYFFKKGFHLKRIAEVEKYDGYSMLFSTRRLSSKEAVKIYFEKDKVEKAFRALKGITRISPVRHWLEDRVKSHVFICYMSYLLLSILEHKLKKDGLEMSCVDALQKLHTIYKVHLRDPKHDNYFEKIVKYSKEHERILKAINPALD
jgi:transposase